MAIKLTTSDFREITRIIQNLPEFSNVRDRRRLLSAALEGVPNSDIILARLDLDGTPLTIGGEVVRFLCEFGQVAYGIEAFSVFLNYIQSFLPVGDSRFIETIIKKYTADNSVNTRLPLIDWKGVETYQDVSEKIIGENTLRHIYFLDKALSASKSVVRLSNSSGLGSGFMIAPHLLMTNNHVIANREEALLTECSFNFQLDQNGLVCPIYYCKVVQNGCFYTNPALDFTVFQVDEVSEEFSKPLLLTDSKVNKGQRVSIIQHPSGHLKKISMQNNFVEYADDQILQYTTSTMPGSSGSPVFNDEFYVVAIHHSGGLLVEPNSQLKYLRNEGISSIAMLKDMQKMAPEIFASLTMV